MAIRTEMQIALLSLAINCMLVGCSGIMQSPKPNLFNPRLSRSLREMYSWMKPQPCFNLIGDCSINQGNHWFIPFKLWEWSQVLISEFVMEAHVVSQNLQSIMVKNGTEMIHYDGRFARVSHCLLFTVPLEFIHCGWYKTSLPGHVPHQDHAILKLREHHLVALVLHCCACWVIERGLAMAISYQDSGVVPSESWMS